MQRGSGPARQAVSVRGFVSLSMRSQLVRHGAPAATGNPRARPQVARAFAAEASPREGMTEVMYNWRVSSVYAALKNMGKETGELSVEDLTKLGHLDQYHYLGVEANDHAIQLLGLDASVHVLDIGSGIGGPARYISAKTGCTITGVELQSDLAQAATDLTKRIPAVADKVSFVTGDFVSLMKDGKVAADSFDHFLSLLVFLHVPDRTSLLDACFQACRPGATFIIEDFMAKPGQDFSSQEVSWLRDVVSAPTVTSAEQYGNDLAAAGFVDIEVVDLSSVWQPWTHDRHRLFVQMKDQYIKQHGQALFDSRAHFYHVIDELFAGNLGGCRITGRKPSRLEQRLLAGRKKDHFQSSATARGTVHVVEGMTRA